MADIEKMTRALQRADQAAESGVPGAAEDARALAREIKRMRTAEKPSVTGDMATQFFDNFNRGMYATANLPTTIANLATDAAGIDYQFKRPLEVAAPKLDQMAMHVPEAQTPAGELAGVVGEYSGAAALPGAGVIGAAPRLAAATAKSTGLGGRVINAMTKPLAATPGKAALGEAVAAGGSGAAVSMLDERGGWPEFYTSLAGGIVAPGVLALAPTNLARKGIRSASKHLSPEAIQKAQRRQISNAFRDKLTPESRDAIRATQEIQADIPGYNPSVAEASESPGLIRTQQVFEGELSGADLDRANQRYRANQAAVDSAIQTQAPQSDIDVDDAFSEGRRRIQDDLQRVDRQSRRADDELARVSGNIQSNDRLRSQGSAIRDDLISSRAATKEEMAITARDMGLNEPDSRFPFSQIKDRLKQAVEPRSQLSDRSAIPHGIISDIDAMDDFASIIDLTELRSRIGADIREAARTPSGEKRVPYLKALQTELDAATDQLIRSVDDPDLADRLTEFRRIYRQDFAVPYEQGAAKRALKTDATGAYVVPDERVANEFFSGWNQSAADQFNRIFPEGSAARSTMEGVALDDLHNFAVRDGIIQPHLIERWIRKNAGVLNDFPGIRQKVSDVESAVGRLAERQASLAARRKQIETSFLAREIKRIDNATATPEAVISQAIKNPARMARLSKGLKTDAAKKALAGQVWRETLDEKNPLEFLHKNRIALVIGMGKPKFETAKRLARAIQKNRLVQAPTGQAIDTNPVADVESIFGTGLNQISSRIFAVQSKRTSSRFVLTDLAGRAFRAMTSRQARATLEEAIYDPQVAADLANALEFEIMSEKSAKRIYTFLISNGITAGNDEPRQSLEVTVRPER